MAIILRGKSLCPLCDCLLLEGESLTALPAIADTAHPLYNFFDSGFHQGCFDEWAYRKEALEEARLDRQRWETSPEYQQLVAQFGKPGRHTNS